MENKLILSLYVKKLEGLDLNIVFDIINLYGNSNIDGIEINTDDLNVLKKCSVLCKKNKLKFMCHTPLKIMSESEVIKYLNCLNDISKTLRYNINVVFHSLNNNKNINEDIEQTSSFMEKVLLYVKKYKLNVTISLENLNRKRGEKRINVNLIDNILKRFEDIKFTYDIGHDLYDNKKASDLSTLQKIKLNDVHIHSVVNSKDHNIINDSSNDIEQIKIALCNLKNINYKGPIVLEYAIDNIPGEKIEEKIINLVKSFDYFKNQIIKNI